MGEKLHDTSGGRKWGLTINNYEQHGMTVEVIKRRIEELKPDYWCMAQEIGAENGTPHVHVFLYRENPLRFGVIKKRFPTAHLERSKGSCRANRDYVAKTGKWEGTEKAETSVEGTFEEGGVMPKERAARDGGSSSEKAEKISMAKLAYDLVEAGLTTDEILEYEPKLAFSASRIDDLQERRRYRMFGEVDREVEVSIYYGATGTGKTRSIMERHGSKNVCRITSYNNERALFDGYRAQDVLVFEEYNSQVPLPSMLSYLDRYPITLPARYQDRHACYTHVYITLNESPRTLYGAIQVTQPESWAAFLRRITEVKHFLHDGTVVDETEEFKNYQPGKSRGTNQIGVM